MALPSDLAVITVTATYESITGTPLTGQVNFSLTTPVQDSTGKVILNAFTQPVPLNPSGAISVVLPCTDNADLNPTNFRYLVTEVIPGLGRAYYVQLPHTLGPTVDLSQLAPVSPPPAATAFASANAWTGTQTFSGNPPLIIPSGAASGDVLTSDTSGHASWQPPSGGSAQWQFPPEAYGAKGDGKAVSDAAITAAQHTLTSPTAPFTAGDTGKSIYVHGAGAAGADLFTTITGFTNATTVSLAAAAGTTVSGHGAVYGTDDTAAIQGALNAAVAYAKANDWYCEITFRAVTYIIAGAPQTGGAGLGNAQILLPWWQNSFPSGTNKKITIAFRGTRAGDQLENNDTPPFSGTVLACIRLDGTSDGTFGPAAVVGGPYAVPGGLTSEFTNLMPVVDGVMITVPANSTYSGWDFVTCNEAKVISGSCQAMAMAQAGAWPAVTTTITNQWTYGLRMPCQNNNANCDIQWFSAVAMSFGIAVSEHTTFESVRSEFCVVGIYVYSGAGPMSHMFRGGYASVENCQFAAVNTSADGIMWGQIDMIDTETPGVMIWDANSNLAGKFGVTVNGSPDWNMYQMHFSGGVPNPGLQVENLRMNSGPGPADPAVPLSGTAQQNLYWRDATVYARPGTATISAIAVDGTVLTGITSGPVRVPSGHTITLTYSGGTPAWQWVLD